MNCKTLSREQQRRAPHWVSHWEKTPACISANEWLTPLKAFKSSPVLCDKITGLWLIGFINVSVYKNRSDPQWHLTAVAWWPCTTCSTATLTFYLLLGDKDSMRTDMRCRVTGVHVVSLLRAEIWWFAFMTLYRTFELTLRLSLLTGGGALKTHLLTLLPDVLEQHFNPTVQEVRLWILLQVCNQVWWRQSGPTRVRRPTHQHTNTRSCVVGSGAPERTIQATG